MKTDALIKLYRAIAYVAARPGDSPGKFKSASACQILANDIKMIITNPNATRQNRVKMQIKLILPILKEPNFITNLKEHYSNVHFNQDDTQFLAELEDLVKELGETNIDIPSEERTDIVDLFKAIDEESIPHNRPQHFSSVTASASLEEQKKVQLILNETAELIQRRDFISALLSAIKDIKQYSSENEPLNNLNIYQMNLLLILEHLEVEFQNKPNYFLSIFQIAIHNLRQIDSNLQIDAVKNRIRHYEGVKLTYEARILFFNKDYSAAFEKYNQAQQWLIHYEKEHPSEPGIKYNIYGLQKSKASALMCSVNNNPPDEKTIATKLEAIRLLEQIPLEFQNEQDWSEIVNWKISHARSEADYAQKFTYDTATYTKADEYFQASIKHCREIMETEGQNNHVLMIQYIEVFESYAQFLDLYMEKPDQALPFYKEAQELILRYWDSITAENRVIYARMYAYTLEKFAKVFDNANESNHAAIKILNQAIKLFELDEDRHEREIPLLQIQIAIRFAMLAQNCDNAVEANQHQEKAVNLLNEAIPIIRAGQPHLNQREKDLLAESETMLLKLIPPQLILDKLNLAYKQVTSNCDYKSANANSQTARELFDKCKVAILYTNNTDFLKTFADTLYNYVDALMCSHGPLDVPIQRNGNEAIKCYRLILECLDKINCPVGLLDHRKNDFVNLLIDQAELVFTSDHGRAIQNYEEVLRLVENTSRSIANVQSIHVQLALRLAQLAKTSDNPEQERYRALALNHLQKSRWNETTLSSDLKDAAKAAWEYLNKMVVSSGPTVFGRQLPSAEPAPSTQSQLHPSDNKKIP